MVGGEKIMPFTFEVSESQMKNILEGTRSLRNLFIYKTVDYKYILFTFMRIIDHIPS